MIILSIETSCDETGISFISVNDNEFTILSNELSSQAKLHSEYGGVYPTLAKREHIKTLPILLKEAIKHSKIKIEEIDAIAVTNGPGLAPALWTGVNFAKDLSVKLQKPIIPVNHMEGHIYSALINYTNISKTKFKISKPEYPLMALLISGGHTEIVYSDSQHKYTYIGGTVDDAVGEAFDKVARMLGLKYPGGPQISLNAKLARDGISYTKYRFKKKLPRPMLNTKNSSLSFSGLKTAVLYLIKDIRKDLLLTNDDKLPADIINDISMQFEDAVAEVIAKKTLDAIKNKNANSLIIGGGVSANGYINTTIKQLISKSISNIKIYLPEKENTGDNALMIGIAGYYQYKNNNVLKDPDLLFAEDNLNLHNT